MTSPTANESAPAPPRKFAPIPIEETISSPKSKPDPTSNGVETKPRRYAPQPIEQSVKSSKDPPQSTTEPEKPKPKRFAPESVEHTARSSKEVRQQPVESDEKAKPRRFAPQLMVEDAEEKPKPRRFAPQLVTEDQEEKPKPRRFAPQLVDEDEDEKSSHNASAMNKKLHVKFKPEPIATTYGSNRKSKRQGRSTPSDSLSPQASASTIPENRPPRKFTPILLDTAKRSRRAGDPNAPISQDYRTEYGYHAHPREHWRRVQGERTPSIATEAEEEGEAMDADETSSVSTTSSQRRKIAPLDGTAPKRDTCLLPKRQHSFRLPDLDTIESSESEEEAFASSLPPTPRQGSSPVAVSDSYQLFEHATKRRESIDDDWQHYLLGLERKKAQQRLEEQALAAYPNVDFGYEHPHHYFNNDDDDDTEMFDIEDRPVTWEGHDEDLTEMRRRESTANASWEQREMQRYAEEAQQERNAKKTTAAKPTGPSPFGKIKKPSDEYDAELRSMLDRARPPMLGKDLVFPRCASPDPARFDVTQGSAALRNQMCYLTAAANGEKNKAKEGGLWQSAAKPENPRDSVVEAPTISKSSTSLKGLWGGFCITETDAAPTRSGIATPPQPSGLMTPKPDDSNLNPFHLAFAEGRPVGITTPGTPGSHKISNRADLQHLTTKLVSEREINDMMEAEYPDSFITQVYNYLSLGYPAVARAFDAELSKISRISVAELRQDDVKAGSAPRGYIRFGSDFEGGGGQGVSEEAGSCVRWVALKKYVREWAKQEKNMVKDGAGWGNMGGTGARRGSWGG